MSTLNVERVRQLADRIEKDDRKRFDMDTYFDHFDLPDDLDLESLAEKLAEKHEPLCGTTACAAGWAVLMFAEKDVLKSCLVSDSRWAGTAERLLGMRAPQSSLFGCTDWSKTEVVESLRRMADAAERGESVDILGDPIQS